MTEQETQQGAAPAADPQESAQAKTAGFDAAAAKAAWMEKWATKPQDKPPEKAAESAAPQPEKAAEPVTEKPRTAVKDLAAKLAGKPAPEAKTEGAKASAWDTNATQALRKLGLREDELPKLEALAAENPWLKGFVEGAHRRITKSDADFAALKAKGPEGARGPTPGALRPQAQQQEDQPGGGQVADLFETLTSKLGEELGDENAKLLRQAFGALEAQNNQLREELHGHTRSVQVEREAAEIEVMVQKSRASLREEFPWIDDDERFEAVAAELAGLRPDEVSPDGVTSAMRKAARIVGYDDVRADVAAMASKLDTKRKTRASDTAPNGNGVHDTGQPLNDYQEFMETARMSNAGMSTEQIQRFVLTNRQRRDRAAQKQ
jgi:hypothetical protein